MRHEVLVPRVSENTEEGILVTWFVEPGQLVRAGDRVAEVQVEKMASEVAAPADGRVRELLAAQGDVVVQGGLLAVIESAADAAEAGGGEAVADSGAAVPGGGTAGAGGVPASPAAKRLARELGIDLADVSGSGPGGRIQESDVQAAATAGKLVVPPVSAAPAPTAPLSEVPAAAPAAGVPGLGAGWRLEPLPAIRRAIGDRLLASTLATAQLTITAEADLTALMAALDAAAARTGRPHAILGSVIRASALALRDHPAVTAAWTADGLAYPAAIDIGCAVALPDGLIVPVVRDPGSRSIAGIEAEVAELAAKARDGRLVPADTTGACFSVTNLGAHRVDAFTPLLNPPQSAILGIGRARLRPAVVDGAIVPRRLAVLSLTFDHRVVDGKPAAAFLDSLLALLEAPDRLIG